MIVHDPRYIMVSKIKIEITDLYIYNVYIPSTNCEFYQPDSNIDNPWN